MCALAGLEECSQMASANLNTKMHRDVYIALIGNPLAWMAGVPWGALASMFTAIYFGRKWLREEWNEWGRDAWHKFHTNRKVKRHERKSRNWGDH